MSASAAKATSANAPSLYQIGCPLSGRYSKRAEDRFGSGPVLLEVSTCSIEPKAKGLTPAGWSLIPGIGGQANRNTHSMASRIGVIQCPRTLPEVSMCCTPLWRTPMQLGCE